MSLPDENKDAPSSFQMSMRMVRRFVIKNICVLNDLIQFFLL